MNTTYLTDEEVVATLSLVPAEKYIELIADEKEPGAGTSDMEKWVAKEIAEGREPYLFGWPTGEFCLVSFVRPARVVLRIRETPAFALAAYRCCQNCSPGKQPYVVFRYKAGKVDSSI